MRSTLRQQSCIAATWYLGTRNTSTAQGHGSPTIGWMPIRELPACAGNPAPIFPVAGASCPSPSKGHPVPFLHKAGNASPHRNPPPFLRLRKRIVQSPLQFTPRRLLVASAPLLEEKRDVVLLALVADVRRPFGLHRARVRSAFAADDHSVDAFQISEFASCRNLVAARGRIPREFGLCIVSVARRLAALVIPLA